MNNIIYNEENLISGLRSAELYARAAFSAACVERIRPVLRRDDGLSMGFDPDLAMERVWDHLGGMTLNPKQCEAYWVGCERAMQIESEGEWTVARALAEDAIAAMFYLFKTVATGSIQDSAWTARRVYEAVCYFAENELGVESDLLSTSPLVMAEVKRQQRDLQDLLLSKENSGVICRQLRQRAIDDADFLVARGN